MSKALEAACVAGVVTIDGLPAPTATILSEGVGASEGLALIDGEEVTYLAKVTPDLKSTIEKLITTITDLSAALTAAVTALGILDAKAIGTLPPAPAAAASIAIITAKIATLTATQAQLAVLKETLK